MELRAWMAGLGLAMTMAAAEAATITYSFTGHAVALSGDWDGMDLNDRIAVTAVVDPAAPTSPGGGFIDYGLTSLTLALPDFPLAFTRVATAFPLRIIDQSDDAFSIHETFSSTVELFVFLRSFDDLPGLEGGSLPTSLDLADFIERNVLLQVNDGVAGCDQPGAAVTCETEFVVDTVTVTVDRSPTPTPEPATLALLGIGFAGLWLRRRR